MRTLFVLALALGACGGSDAPADKPATSEKKPEAKPDKTPAPKVPAQHTAMFKPLPKAELGNKAMVDLGRQLYYEPRLSLSQEISCNSCHMLDKYGVDGEPTSPGHKGQRGGRNSPTSLNAFLHLAQFWDGREPDVEAQAKGPILNPIEMAMPSEEATVAVLKSIPGYVEGFKAAFPSDEDPVTYQHMADAIGAFERGLVTPGKFDTYLGGDASALTDAEKKGLDTFISTGCTACHMGPLLGGTMYQKLGLVEPYPSEDQGRFDETKNEADRMMFKVPSLRNIAKTGPYFHDGKVATLDEAVTLMAKHQLGKQLTAKETKSIVTFLDALTGEPPKTYIAKPELPASGPKTPAPDPS